MKKSLLSLFLSGSVILTSLSVHAVGQNDPIGGLIKNKKTKEYLGTRCTDDNELDECKNIIFALYEKDGDSFIHLKDIGNKFSYGIISGSRKDGLTRQYDDRDYPEIYIDTHALALPIALMVDSLAGDYSIAGGAWRFLTGLVLFPLAAVGDGVRYAGETVAAGAVSVYEITEDTINKGKANRSYVSMVKASRKTSQGKVVKMSEKKFDKLLKVIQNH